MLDIRYVRDNQEAVAQAMANRNFPWDAELFASLDEQRREAISAEESLQAERNAASKEIGKLMGAGKKEEAEAAKEQVRQINEKLAEASAKREKVDAKLNDILVGSPNIPCDATPVGKDESENPERRRWGTPREFDFDFKPHWDLGTDLDILDFDEAISFRAAVSRCSAVRALVLSARSSTISSIRTRPAVSKNGGRLSS